MRLCYLVCNGRFLGLFVRNIHVVEVCIICIGFDLFTFLRRDECCDTSVESRIKVSHHKHNLQHTKHIKTEEPENSVL